MNLTLNPFHVYSLSVNNVALSSNCGVQHKTQQRPRLLPCRMSYSTANQQEKVIVILGGTGSGKSRFSIDLATQLSGEIINSDKIQIYKGLDIAGNRITVPEQRGVPHHLLGVFDHNDPEFTATDFRSVGADLISDISSRGKIPIVVGCTNSFVYSLMAERFDPEADVFTDHGSICSNVRYDSCFLWVDVALPVLFDCLRKRVDEMLDAGLFEELEQYLGSDKSTGHPAIAKTVGVREFESYFRKQKMRAKGNREERERDEDYQRAVREMKENTCQLVKRQVGKILRLREAGWDIHRLDATAAVKEKLTPSSNAEGWTDIWNRDMIEPSLEIVKRFLEK